MGSGFSKHEDEKISKSSNATAATTTNNSDDESKCPMKLSDGSYRYDWGALFRKDFPHGPNGSRPLEQVPEIQTNQESGCPVKHQEYNVYSQPLDPTNNMPKVANQLPAPGQTKPISTERVASSILKVSLPVGRFCQKARGISWLTHTLLQGGAKEGTTWTYPSPQMFYNALARKGKLSDQNEEEEEEEMMETVVALHNDMNEKSWKKVLQWEAVVAGKDEEVVSKETKLLKFQGRPSDLSPKAWFKHYLLGHPLPFDRHDWVVLRSDGSTIRYVLDYYYNEPDAEEGNNSEYNSRPSSSQTLLVDVRPALDGISPLWHRCAFMPWARHVSQSTSFVPLPMLPTSGLKSQVSESVQVWQSIQASVAQSKSGQATDSTISSSITEQEAQKLVEDFSTATQKCQKQRNALDKCASEEECTRATMDLTIGMGHTLCPLQHQTLLKALQQDDENTIEAALERVSECVTLKSQQHAMAKQQHPKLFQ